MTLSCRNSIFVFSGCKTNKSIGVHASNNENSDSDNNDYLIRASKMKELKHPAKPLFQSESDVDVTIHSDEESDEEDYHSISECTFSPSGKTLPEKDFKCALVCLVKWPLMNLSS